MQKYRYKLIYIVFYNLLIKIIISNAYKSDDYDLKIFSYWSYIYIHDISRYVIEGAARGLALPSLTSSVTPQRGPLSLHRRPQRLQCKQHRNFF